MNDKVIFEYVLEPEMVQYVLDVLLENRMPVVLEGSTDYWIDRWGFGEDSYVDYLYADLGDKAHTIEGYDERMRINKFSADIIKETDYQAVKNTLGDKFHILEHVENVVEFVPKKYSKKTGIEWMCRYLNIDIEDTFAIGDSVNDIEMLKAVGHGIAMGNATEGAKNAAEYVTAEIHDDGVYKALDYFKLI